jgi:hypothetical protein
VRDQAIRDLHLTQPYPRIARATAALVDARADARPLTVTQLRDVQAVLDMEIPEPPEPAPKHRNMFVIPASRTPRGLSIVAELATQHLNELSPGSDRKIYDIAQRVWFVDGVRIVRLLRAAGIETKSWSRPNPLAGLIAAFGHQSKYEQELLSDITSLGEPGHTTPLTTVDRWSLRELADLLNATGYSKIGFTEFRQAFTEDAPELRRPWLQAVAALFDLDLDKLAAQAQHVLTTTEHNESRQLEEWSVLTERSSPPARRPLFDRMRDVEQRAALEGLFAASDWVAHCSMWLLMNSTATWDREELFTMPLKDTTPSRASEVRQVAILASPVSTDLLERAAVSSRPSYRHAARRAIEMLTTLDPEMKLHQQLASDPDLWVRGRKLQAVVDAPPAEYWSCALCGCKNGTQVEDCCGCIRGRRPRTSD